MTIPAEGLTKRLTKEQVMWAARELFSHYGWRNSGDRVMRDNIEQMRDLALSRLEELEMFIEDSIKKADALRAPPATTREYPAEWNEAVDKFADDCFARLSAASKGEPDTWGFVHMFREMLEETRSALKRADEAQSVSTREYQRGEDDANILDTLDWERLRSGDKRALNPDNQLLFDAYWQAQEPASRFSRNEAREEGYREGLAAAAKCVGGHAKDTHMELAARIRALSENPPPVTQEVLDSNDAYLKGLHQGHQLGMAAMREMAAKVCDESQIINGWLFAKAIRALGDEGKPA